MSAKNKPLSAKSKALIVLGVFISFLLVIFVGELVGSKYPILALAIAIAIVVLIIFGKEPAKH